jgi:hypothetical protein
MPANSDTVYLDVVRRMWRRRDLTAAHEAGLHTNLARLGGGPGRQTDCHLCSRPANGDALPPPHRGLHKNRYRALEAEGQ